MLRIDINCDVGEGFGRWTLGDDDALLGLITSASVACGFHAGDAATMRRVCEQAAERGVAVGAQVGYRDLPGFGRRFVDVEPAQLTDEVLYQIGALQGLAHVAGTRVRYVKAHGALHAAIRHHRGQAAALVEAVRSYDPGLAVLGVPRSVFADLAREAGLTVHEEAFPDRAYTSDGELVPRRQAGAVVTDPEAVAARAVRMVTERAVEAQDGSTVVVQPASLCVHGDTPGAVPIVARVRSALAEAGVALQPFA